PRREPEDGRCDRRRSRLPRHDAGPLEVAQAIGEQVGRYAGQAMEQVGVAAAAAQQQLADDQQIPAIADHVERPRDGAVLAVGPHAGILHEPPEEITHILENLKQMRYKARMRTKPLILVSLLLAAFAINLDTTIVNVALPTLVRELHASNSQLQLVVDAYNLVFAALLLASGSLSDRVGRKGMLLSGLGVFGLSSALGGLMSTPGQLIVARCVMGLGAAMIFPATLSLISNVFVERGERARAIGLWGATAGAAIALGPIAGGWLLQRFSWTSIFFAMAPVAALAGVLVAWVVPTSRDPHAPKAD